MPDKHRIDSAVPKLVYSANHDYETMYKMAWRMAADNVEIPSNPKWLPQMCCMPGSGYLWQWDSCFMALFSRYSNGSMTALNNLDNLYRLQREDGYISMTYCIETDKEAYGERINPPLYAWAEYEHYKFTGDLKRIERVYPILKKYFFWIKNNRRRINGLYYFEDTGSSGMDNSPRSGYAADRLAGSDVCFIDLSCQQVLAAKKLAMMAQALGLKNDENEFEKEASDLSALINRYCWSERHGFYYDCFARSSADSHHNLLANKTAASFWAIISGVANDSQLSRLVNMICNPDEFWTEHPVPTLAKSDPNYTPFGGYWLGSVWAPTNYMIVRGLQERGCSMLAREIAFKHIKAMAAVMNDQNYGGIWECYSPEYMRPATRENGGAVRENFVGWSGLGPISMMIETILGFEFNALSNTVSWTVREKEPHGIESLKFNGQIISLMSEGCLGLDKTFIKVKAGKAFKLKIKVPYAWDEKVFDIKPGEQTITL